MLLSSKGYCITCNQLSIIDNAFIERLWECIQVVSNNVPLYMSQWINECLDNRSSSNFAMLYCQSKPSMTQIDFLGNYISDKDKAVEISAETTAFPDTLWHKDDAARQTFLTHIVLGYGNLTNNRE